MQARHERKCARGKGKARSGGVSGLLFELFTDAFAVGSTHLVSIHQHRVFAVVVVQGEVLDFPAAAWIVTARA